MVTCHTVINGTQYNQSTWKSKVPISNHNGTKSIKTVKPFHSAHPSRLPLLTRCIKLRRGVGNWRIYPGCKIPRYFNLIYKANRYWTCFFFNYSLVSIGLKKLKEKVVFKFFFRIREERNHGYLYDKYPILLWYTGVSQ